MAVGEQLLIQMVVRMEDETKGAVASVTAGLRSMAGSAEQASGPFGRVAEIAAGIVAAQVLHRVADGIASTARAAIDAVGNYEALSFQLQALLAREQLLQDPTLSMRDAYASSAEAAKAFVGWVTQLALLSPFTEEDVAYIVRIGMSYGMSSEMAREMVQALANLGAATGLPADQMQRLGLALGQVQARGYLTGEEMRQLTNAGIGVDSIARAMGISINQVAEAIKGKQIAAEALLPALFSIINSDFGGAAEQMAFSWMGLRSTINDVAQITLRTLLGPALTEIKPLIVEFLTRLQDPNTIAQLTALGERLGVWVVDALKKLGEIVAFVKEHWDAFSGAITGVGIALGALAILGTVALAVGALSSPIVLIIGLAASLGAAWNTNWGGIRDKAEEVWGVLEPIFEGIGGWLKETFPNGLSSLVEYIKGFVSETGRAFKEAYHNVVDPLELAAEKIKEAFSALAGPIRSAADVIKNIFTSLHIPLPHVNVAWNWHGVGNIGLYVPSVSVDWYGSGLNAVVDRPTLIGVGEAGPERVVVTPLGRGRGGGTKQGSEGNSYVLHYYSLRPETGRADVEEAMRRFEWQVRMSYG